MKVLSVRAATWEEEFYLKLDEEDTRQSLPRLNDAIGRMLTLSTGLAGGALVFLKDDVCTGWARVAAAACFFVALLVSAGGSIPLSRNVPRDPDAIRENRETVYRAKRRTLFVAWLGTALGIAVAIVGAGVKAAG